MTDIDRSVTSAYQLGINGLNLNLKGRERDGIVAVCETPCLRGGLWR
jgi:predicted AlkP superfamily phosphohydrolase/phosphomutase